MAVSEKSELLFSEQQILIRIRFRKDVVVLIGNGAVDELALLIDLEWSNREVCQIFPVCIRKHCPSPIDGEACVRIELIRVVQPRRNPVMISTNRNRVQCPYSVD